MALLQSGERARQLGGLTSADAHLLSVSKEKGSLDTTIILSDCTLGMPFIPPFLMTCIEAWLAQGNTTCPKTRQPLTSMTVVPNYTVKAMIAGWCEEHGVPLPQPPSEYGLDDRKCGTGRSDPAIHVQRLEELTLQGTVTCDDGSGTRDAGRVENVRRDRFPHFVRCADVDSGGSSPDSSSYPTSPSIPEDSPLSSPASFTVSVHPPDHAGHVMVRHAGQPAHQRGHSRRSYSDIGLSSDPSRCSESSIASPASSSRSPLTRTVSMGGLEDQQVKDVTDNDIEDLFVCLSDYEDPDNQAWAAGEVRRLVKHSAKNRAVLGASVILGILVQLLNVPHREVMVNAAAAIVNISIDDQNKRLLPEAGAVPVLVQALKCSDAEVQEHAAGAIFSLCQSEDNRLMIGSAGAIPPLVQVLITGGPRAHKDCIRALHKLSHNQIHKGKLVRAGLVPQLLATVSRATSTRPSLAPDSLLTHAMVILANLAASTDGRTAIMDAGGMGVIMKILKSEDVDIRQAAVAILLQLGKGNVRFKAHMQESGAVQLLMKMISEGSPRGRERVSLLLKLCTDIPRPSLDLALGQTCSRSYLARHMRTPDTV
eukprot:SM000054S18119  [mRNA]  locus=s54:522505:526088:- [translate_table: standard]